LDLPAFGQAKFLPSGYPLRTLYLPAFRSGSRRGAWRLTGQGYRAGLSARGLSWRSGALLKARAWYPWPVRCYHHGKVPATMTATHFQACSGFSTNQIVGNLNWRRTSTGNFSNFPPTFQVLKPVIKGTKRYSKSNVLIIGSQCYEENVCKREPNTIEISR